MTEIFALWLPILLSSVLVFIVSSLIHMVTPWHKSDYPMIPDEGKFMDAVRPLAVPPGDYMVPSAASMKEMRSPEFLEKKNKGPNMMLTVWPNGMTGMGKSMVLWFLYLVVVGIFAAYVTRCALPIGADYIHVFRFAAVTSFLAYAGALCQYSIWFRRSWLTTFKSAVDGLIYGLLTAGVFGWLWPR